MFGVLGGRLSDRYGSARIAFIGLTASSIAFLGLPTVTPETETNFIIFCQLLFGIRFKLKHYNNFNGTVYTI